MTMMPVLQEQGVKLTSMRLFYAQNATSTKAEAERTFAEVTGLDSEVNTMLQQLQEAEKELKRKQDDADQDMMMAGMVRAARGYWA